MSYRILHAKGVEDCSIDLKGFFSEEAVIADSESGQWYFVCRNFNNDKYELVIPNVLCLNKL